MSCPLADFRPLYIFRSISLCEGSPITGSLVVSAQPSTGPEPDKISIYSWRNSKMKQLTTNCKITENDLRSSFWYDIIKL